MLYDNALLLRAYAHLHRRTGSDLAGRVAIETAHFLRTELVTRQGGFAAALDADTDGVEGMTYVWTPAQLIDVLGEPDGRWAMITCGVTDDRTFEMGASTLRLPIDPDDADRWASVRMRLLAARATRPQPARDDKVVTAWNGLAIGALAEAGVAMRQPTWIAAATTAAEFLVDTHLVAGRLRRTSRNGVVGTSAGVLEDYGCLAEGLLALHQATADPRWLDTATGLLRTALDHFADPTAPGTFFDTADDAERLVNRPSDPSDNASPAGASALAGALLTASALTGDTAYRDRATEMLGRAGLLIARAPRFAGHWASVAEAWLAGPRQVAVVGESEQLRAAVVAAAAGGTVAVAGSPDTPGVPLLADRPLVDGGAAVYVCHGFVCDRPVTTPDEVLSALS